MNGSLEIIRDEIGYFRHPDGHPLVVIFDSKHGQGRLPDEISWQDPVIGFRPHEEDTSHYSSKTPKDDTQPRKFVNIFHPIVHGKRTRRTVRTNVAQDRQRRKRKHESSLGKSFASGSAGAHNTTLWKKALQFTSNNTISQATSLPRQPSVLISSFTTFPVNMEPYMHKLINQYISLISNLTKPSELDCEQDILARHGWLPLAMTDAALFHSILCTAALYLELLTGRRESPEKVKHMKEAVHLLSTRLQDPRSELSDSTIFAVTHLADTESIAGNFANWSHHMDGLYTMVQIRGGFASLNDDLKNKIWRADMIGCVGTLSKPRFDVVDVRNLSLPRKRPASAFCSGLKNIVELLPFNGDLIDILGELQILTLDLNNAQMDLPTIDQIVATIQYRLLLVHSAGYEYSQNAVIQELCCVGALAYLRTVFYFHLCLHVGGFSANALHGEAMLEKLKSCLGMADTNAAASRGLLLWTMFIGGAAATGTKNRAWFVARLVKTVMDLQIRSWEDARSSLMKFLWVDRIHERSCRELWDEAMVTMTVLFGS